VLQKPASMNIIHVWGILPGIKIDHLASLRDSCAILVSLYPLVPDLESLQFDRMMTHAGVVCVWLGLITCWLEGDGVVG